MDAARSRDKSARKRRGGPRKKTGCSTCKARHTRCDGKAPTCANCERLSLDCRPSEFILQSTWSSATIISSPSTAREPSRSLARGLHTTPAPRTAAETVTREPLGLSASPDSHNTTPELQLSPKPVASPSVGLQDETVRLLTIFRSSLATWMDIFDFSETYQREVCRRALHSHLVLYCICAITAKHLSLLPSGEVWQPTASRYYGKALQHLIVALSRVRPDTNGDELTASMLLASYEVIVASGTPHYSHYQGSMDLIRSQNISAASSGMNRANFLIYVRHEITIALAREKPLRSNPKDWRILQQPSPDMGEDDMGNCLLWLSGSVVNLIYGTDVISSDRKSLIDCADDWYSCTTETFRGISYGDLDEAGLQKLFFAVPAAGKLPYHG
ncbi:C6 zinc finger domain protein [Xylaria intraflava]|nr:C6 zinc finger domain protein [Xylaria intraflava]